MSGENSKDAAANVLPEDKEAALFMQHIQKVAVLKDKMATISGEIRSAYKIAKADGFTKKEIEFAIALEKDEDDSILQQRIRENQIAKWMGLPLGSQAELELEPDRRPVEERAAAEGKRDGMKGGSLQPPYAPGAPGYNEYVENWHIGAAALFSVKQGETDTEVIRPESEDEGLSDDFDEAADDFQPPEFLTKSESHTTH